MRRATLLAVGLVVILAGCSLAAPTADTDRDTIRLEPTTLDDNRSLGEVNGYTATDTFDLDETDLSEADLEALKYRSMARIETIRGLQFENDVAFEIVTREQYQAESTRGDGSAGPYTNELWRAKFIVDGETDYNEALNELYGGSVMGYYSNDRFVLVVDSLETLRVDRNTLVHELVHALQDQHFGLTREGTTHDERRAETGLFEGEAVYIPHTYDQRCGVEWECLSDLERGVGSTQSLSFNLGLYVSVYAPYAAGPGFVEHRYDAAGWEGVDTVYDERPASTEQLIHPDRYPDVRPSDVSIDDRSSADWEPVTTDDGDLRTETVGEATLFASLYANGVLDRSITEGGSDLSPFNYSHPTTDGWAGDSLVVYRDADETRTGHVWELAWKTDDDASAFHDAYLELLDERGAEAVAGGDGVYHIPDDRSFTGAYSVALDGETVTIVGGPSVDSLEEIHDRVPVAASLSSPGVETGVASPSVPESPQPARPAPA